MNATEIKTRHGLILQGLVREALKLTSKTFRENWQYDSDCERPDFTIPGNDDPKFIIEVHQTEAYNSFLMKIMRAFTAVIEFKAFFAEDTISVNILFGQPYKELPKRSVDALCDFFDINILPSQESNSEIFARLEEECLYLASDDTFDVAISVLKLLQTQASAIVDLSNLIDDSLNKAQAKTLFVDLWKFEKERLRLLNSEIPHTSKNTYYKRSLLKSLFLSDSHFDDLLKQIDPNKCSIETCKQLKLVEIVKSYPSIRGEVFSLDPMFIEFLRDTKANYFRNLCKYQLEKDNAMKYFFDDIRDSNRRITMAEIFLSSFHQGWDNLSSLIEINLNSDTIELITHQRCWTFELLILTLSVGLKEFGRNIFTKGRNILNLQDPAGHIALKTERFMVYPNYFHIYAQDIIKSANYFFINKPQLSIPTSLELANKLLKYRIEAAIKLQKLNPLYIILESITEKLGLQATYQGTDSLLYDVSGKSSTVGKYNLYHITDGKKIVLANILAVHDNNGDHKSKEWGARRRSTLYRIANDKVSRSKFKEGLFIIDGEWNQKDINRLYKSGWNYIIHLTEVEETLKFIFSI